MTNKIKTFENPFQALDWCYRNPMREIEYFCVEEEQIHSLRYNIDLEKMQYFGKVKRRGVIEEKWRFFESIEFVRHWRNINIKEEDDK
jgi:hypothetical protein